MLGNTFALTEAYRKVLISGQAKLSLERIRIMCGQLIVLNLFTSLLSRSYQL